MKHLRRLEDLQFCWDRNLAPNEFRKDPAGLWHIGLGTDLHGFIFRANLTERDKEFLEAIRVGVDDGV